PLGRIGSENFTATPLPGQFIIAGLPDRPVEVRIAAVGTALTRKSVGGARVTLVPHRRVTVDLTLGDSTADSDSDGVPDAIHHCPSVPDAMQADASGTPPGDACRGSIPGSDLHAGSDLGAGGGDLANPSGSHDMATGGPPDMRNPPPDMMRPPSNCGAITS